MIIGRRKFFGKNVYVEVKLELVVLEEVFKEFGIDREKFIELVILVGIDYNFGGIKGIGLKKVLIIVKRMKDLLVKY